MKEYPKIPGPYRRHTTGPDRNKLIEGDWSTPELDYLQNAEWIFTEKVDGTNIRVHWDGHKTTYGGRTANAQIPAKLIESLDALLPEELLEQVFGAQPATLFGEGFGAGIQKAGAQYRESQSFVLFDVLIDEWWLRRLSVEDIADRLGIEVVPKVATGTLHDGIQIVRNGLKSEWGPFVAEGVVGVPTAGLLDRAGKRISVKLKMKDFLPRAGGDDRG